MGSLFSCPVPVDPDSEDEYRSENPQDNWLLVNNDTDAINIIISKFK